MDPSQETTAPNAWSALRAGWREDPFLPRAFVALACTPLLALVLPTEAGFYISRSLGIALVLLALVPLPRFERPEETVFWRNLSLALGFWLLSRAIEAVNPDPAPIAIDLLIEILLGAHYISFILALEHQPHSERRRVGLENTLISPTVSVFVAGIFCYFVLIPLYSASQVTPQASFFFYCSLDTYLLLRLLYLRLKTQDNLRWRLFYSLFAASIALILLGDFDSFHQNLHPEDPLLPGPLPLILWILPFFPLLLLARSRHGKHLLSLRNEKKARFRAPSTGSLETLLAALAFPLIHLWGNSTGLFASESRGYREDVVLIWLLLLGGLSMGQHRLANRRARDLARRKALTSAALAKNQTSLRLLHERKQAQRQLHNVELRCATIFRASPSGLLICDLADGRIREVNQNFEELSGRPREALLDQTIPQLNLWANSTLHAQMVERLEQGEHIHNETAELVIAPQETCRVLLSAEILHTEGTPAMLCVLRRSPPPATSPSQWLHSTDLGIVGIDGKGRISCMSRGAARHYGVTEEEVLGRPAQELIADLLTDSRPQPPNPPLPSDALHNDISQLMVPLRGAPAESPEALVLITAPLRTVEKSS